MSHKISTIIDGEIMGVPVSIPVVIEYDYHKTLPGCGMSPREPAHVVIKSMRITEGLSVSHNAPFLAPYKRLIEDQILNDIRDERRTA